MLLHFLHKTTLCTAAHYGYTLLIIEGGGYVISPVNQRKQSIVKHMLAIDWRSWKSYLRTSSSRYITIHMLGRLAGVFYCEISLFMFTYYDCSWGLNLCFTAAFVALRELFIEKLGDCSSSYFLEEKVRDKRLHHIEEVKVEIQTRPENGKNMADMGDEEVPKEPSEHSSLIGLNDASDEFFDVSKPLDYDESENGWPDDFGPEMHSQVLPV